MLRLAHLAQEDSRLPATRETVGSLTRVVHVRPERVSSWDHAKLGGAY